MTDVLLLHHAQGRTSGVLAFADDLAAQGHEIHVPDLFEGHVFDDLRAGVAHAEEVGFETIVDRGVAAADNLPGPIVYVGFSLGVLPAQKLAQTRPGALGAVLVGSCVPPEAFGAPWPSAVPVQVHGMDRDEIFVGDGDLDAARNLVAGAAAGELFLYPGDGHLFADRSLPTFDAEAADLLTRRVVQFLSSVG